MIRQPHPLEAISGALAEITAGTDVRRLDDDELIETMAAVEQLGRLVDSLRVGAAAEVAARSRKQLGPDGLASKRGCRSPNELLQRVTRVSAATAEKRMRLGAFTRSHPTLLGFDQPAAFPRVAGALAAGELGTDAAEAIVRGLGPALTHGDLTDLAAAERELVAAATGTGPDTPVPFAADEIRIQAQLWQSVLDPDGVRDSEEVALARRGLKLGREREGLVPLTGHLLPEIAAKLTRLLDTCLSPTTGPRFLGSDRASAASRTPAEGTIPPAGEAPPEDASSTEASSAHDAPTQEYGDTRSRDQQRHDGLAALIDVIARSGQTPVIGGAPPTVLVTVRASDLAAGRGVGHIDGCDTPISMRAVSQFTCAGGIQTVTLGENGRITELGSPQRCFTPSQRKAIMVRDGGCIIPGCSVPAGWTEIHHVNPAAHGGATHTDNGVCLCWFHHRTIETSRWGIRMIRGAPQIKAPPWIDPTPRWMPASKSRTALTDALERKRDIAYARTA